MDFIRCLFIVYIFLSLINTKIIFYFAHQFIFLKKVNIFLFNTIVLGCKVLIHITWFLHVHVYLFCMYNPPFINRVRPVNRQSEVSLDTNTVLVLTQAIQDKTRKTPLILQSLYKLKETLTRFEL